MAPELLLGYRYSSYSADMWAYGCMLGALIFRDLILFPGHGKINQLHTIARVRTFHLNTTLHSALMFPTFNVLLLLLLKFAIS